MILIVQCDARVPAGIYGELLRTWKIPSLTWQAHAEPAPPGEGPWSGVVLLGGYMGVHDEADFPFLAKIKQALRAWLEADLPLFGICLGGQLLAQALGGEVSPATRGEKGCREVQLTAAGRGDDLFCGIAATFPAFQWHNDSFGIPAGATHLAFSAACPGQAIRAGRAWGVQFHPEVDLAIVDAWRRKTGAGPEVVAEFRRHEPQLRAVAERLLRNFLSCCGLAAEAGAAAAYRSDQ